mgnify:CR=1 FL=1
MLLLAGLALTYRGLDAILRRLRRRPVETGLWLSVAWLAVVVLSAVFADLLPLAEAQDQSLTQETVPRLRPDLLSAHPLGTDGQALDVLGGVIYGARISLQVGLLAVAVGMAVGGVIGVMAGYLRGRTDAVVGTLSDSVLAFPPLILLLAVVTVFRPNVTSIGLALALLTIPTFVRLARATTLTFAPREFVQAAKVVGAKQRRIIFRELLPNVVRPLVSYSFVVIAVLIVAEASLSYLGVGIQRPTPTWGNMIAAGQSEHDRTPHLVFVPGTVMFLTVFALNRVGDRARQLWDPRDTHT